MNKFQPYDELSSALRFNDFAVCWAGSCPHPSGFCFGSEDGKLLLTDDAGQALGPPTPASNSGEAVNGVAWLPHWMAISTRYEVTLQKLSRPATEKHLAATLPIGVHDVVATAGGYFACAAGHSGLVLAKPDPSLKDSPFILGGADDNSPYFYRIISLQFGLGREVLVCATRDDGIAALEFEGEQQAYNLGMVSYEGLDVVDVCALDPGSNSPGVAALGRDGTIVLLRDVLHDKQPVALRFESIQGVAYRLLSCRGDIYVLTDKGLFMLGKLGEQFLAGTLPPDSYTRIRSWPMDPVDANLVHDRWLLVLMPDHARKFDVNLIHESIPEHGANGTTRSGPFGHAKIQDSRRIILTPDWARRNVQQSSRLSEGVTRTSA